FGDWFLEIGYWFFYAKDGRERGHLRRRRRRQCLLRFLWLFFHTPGGAGAMRFFPALPPASAGRGFHRHHFSFFPRQHFADIRLSIPTWIEFRVCEPPSDRRGNLRLKNRQPPAAASDLSAGCVHPPGLHFGIRIGKLYRNRGRTWLPYSFVARSDSSDP